MTANFDAEQFLAGRINYERALSMPNSEEAFKLDRMRELLRRLGDPQRAMPIIHVAGTKGKGSTAAMIAAILTAAGLRTGLFSSPHIDCVEERMTVDGHSCPTDEFAELVESVKPAVEAMDLESARRDPPELGPTYFEIITVMALLHFASKQVDAAVLEVGLGGRLDSTNVCTPCLSIITSISFDHTRQLGDTLARIAAEKAGIIKPGAAVVSGVRLAEPREVIRRTARQAGCRLVELGVDFDFDYHPPRNLERAPSSATFDYFKPRSASGANSSPDDCGLSSVVLSLLGRHQAANAATALAAVEELRRAGWRIPEAAIRRGLAGLSWPARVEVLARRPTVVVDAAHNAASIEALMETLDESFAAARRLLIFATTLDKDVEGMLRILLGRFDRVIFTRYANNPRGVPPEELQRLAAAIRPRPSALPLSDGITSDAERSLVPRPCLTDMLGATAGLPGSAENTVGQPNRGVRQFRSVEALEIAPTPSDAWNAVCGIARPDDLICIAGSFFLAAELRRLIAARPLICS
ncbi:MAG: bifunctional folylpolyglutamate synthase/dihydrofolate synthase [Pirellulaceae bacterium]|nr:bifunctional folylpolyglutamate synthase/dihydrofolate synthase [Pirellulaceae bacterium]